MCVFFSYFFDTLQWDSQIICVGCRTNTDASCALFYGQRLCFYHLFIIAVWRHRFFFLFTFVWHGSKLTFFNSNTIKFFFLWRDFWYFERKKNLTRFNEMKKEKEKRWEPKLDPVQINSMSIIWTIFSLFGEWFYIETLNEIIQNIATFFLFFGVLTWELNKKHRLDEKCPCQLTNCH